MELWRRAWGSQSIQTLEISEFLQMQSDWMKYIILDYIRWSFGACWNWKVDVCKCSSCLFHFFSNSIQSKSVNTAERCPRRTWGMPSEKAQACDVERCWKMEDVKSESQREREREIIYLRDAVNPGMFWSLGPSFTVLNQGSYFLSETVLCLCKCSRPLTIPLLWLWL